MINTDKEYILCAAIHFDDGERRDHNPRNISEGFVVCGRRHHNCFGVSHALRGDVSYLKYEKTQGFLTSLDRFVDREEGAIIAQEAGQLKKPTDILFSEDLY